MQNSSKVVFKLMVEHSYMCKVITPMVISTQTTRDIDDWESFSKLLETRLKEVEKSVTGPDQRYVNELNALEHTIRMSVTNWRESK